MSDPILTQVVLGPTRYGKAEVRLVHVAKVGREHGLKDLNVSVALGGDQAETHLTGDNAKVLTTDAQKNAVYALAKQHGVAAIEEFALLLARHFLTTCPYISHARIAIDEYAWDRIAGTRSRHSFVRSGSETRTALVHADANGTASVISGLKDLVVLNSTGSEFHDFFKDEYTTLAETSDRVLATAVDARWRHIAQTDVWQRDWAKDWDKSYAEARAALLTAFADTYSLLPPADALRDGGAADRPRRPDREVRLALPNRHHFAVDLAPFGLTNDNEVFYAADRPYGLIEGTVANAAVRPDPAAWGDGHGMRTSGPAARRWTSFAPATWAEALESKAARPDARADPRRYRRDGRAELRPAPAQRPARPGPRSPSCSSGSVDGGTVQLGAAVTYARIIEELGDRLPGAGQGRAHRRFAADPQPRHRRRQPGHRLARPGTRIPALLADRRGGRGRVAAPGHPADPAADFYTGVKRNAMEPDELITGGPDQAGHRPAVLLQDRHPQRHGHRGLLVLDRPAPRRRRVGTGIGSAGPKPLRAIEAEELLGAELDWDGGPLDPRLAARFGELVAAAAHPIDDVRGTAAYRRHALSVLARRALRWAWQRARPRGRSKEPSMRVT